MTKITFDITNPSSGSCKITFTDDKEQILFVLNGILSRKDNYFYIQGFGDLLKKSKEVSIKNKDIFYIENDKLFFIIQLLKNRGFGRI